MNDAPIPPQRPTLLEMASNFKEATGEWARSGFPIVEEKEYDRRHKVCSGCDQWDSNAFGGVGRCHACGCTGFKLYLATSVCPLKKWAADLNKDGRPDSSETN